MGSHRVRYNLATEQQQQVTWMNLGNSMWSEIRQTQKEKYCITPFMSNILYIYATVRKKVCTYYTKWSKSERKTPVQYVNKYMWNLVRWYRWLYTRDGKRDTDVKNRLLDFWENSIETCILHVYYHMWNRFPVQVWCMRQCAQGRCTGMTLRDGKGNTGTPTADSCQCMAKTTTIL